MIAVAPSTAKGLFKFTTELVNSQLPCGSWHSDSPNLQSIVLTTQGTLLLSTFRGTAIRKSLNNSLAWLTGQATVASEVSYWRLLPLIKANAETSVIDHAYGHVKKQVDDAILHHKNSPLKGFYLECCAQLGKRDQTTIDVIGEIRSHLENEAAERSAELLTYGLANLLDLGEAIDAIKILKAVEEKSTQSGNMRYWPTLVSTAYSTLNLFRIATISRDKKIVGKSRRLASEAVTYLGAQWENGKFESEPLAGGNFNETRYAQIITARALVCAADIEDPRWREDVSFQEHVSPARPLDESLKSMAEEIETKNIVLSRKLARLGLACAALSLASCELIIFIFVNKYGEGTNWLRRIKDCYVFFGIGPIIALGVGWLAIGRDELLRLGWPFTKIFKVE